jgi:hypothetical protein
MTAHSQHKLEVRVLDQQIENAECAEIAEKQVLMPIASLRPQRSLRFALNNVYPYCQRRTT